jgi:hypothetical protein
MPSQNLGQARVISPVNTQLAIGLQQNESVGQYLFPRIGVDMRSGKIITFGREHFMQYAGMQRSPGAATPRVKFGYAGSDYQLKDFSIEGTLPVEVQQEQRATSKGFTIDGARMAMTGAMTVVNNRLEIAQAALATDLSNYPAANKVTLTSGSQFNDSGGDPIAVAVAARSAIRAATGKDVNTAVFSAKAMEATLENPKVLARLNYTGVNVAGIEDLRRILRIPNIYVGGGITSADDGVTISDIWGKDVVFAYTETASLASMGLPTYGVTYQLNGYPFAEPAYYDNNHKTWYFPVTSCENPVITSNVAGYLVKNAVA